MTLMIEEDDCNRLTENRQCDDGAHGGNLFEGFGQNDYDILNIFNEAKKKIDFSANINSLGLSKNALCILKNTKLLKFLIENYPEIYPERLINKLSDYHCVQSGNIFIGAGATDLIYKILSVFQPENALIAEPSFSEYERACRAFNINTVHQCTLLEDSFKLINGSLTEFIEKINKLNERDLIFIASPSNPAGVITPVNTVIEILKICKKKNIYLILDESFMDFKEEYSSKHLIEKFDNLIVLRSLTKFFAIPGERLGYIVSCEKNILNMSKNNTPWSIGGLASALAVSSLSDTGYIENSVKYINKLKKEMYNDIMRLKIFEIINGEANFLLLKIKTGYHLDNTNNNNNNNHHQHQLSSALTIKDYLFNKGILIRYAGNYRCLDGSFFRIAVKTRKDNKILISELKKIEI
ncbi:MAG: aminotransferase class I/II-fold pyridoxal phosphate-dependent enzyme [Candidatus Acididesulfobacter guangdongensis]|uniref:Aminotransferase n=1 Tax=Acididesulfobacter guangdongensis TaxID=2597225 RepID=A0A519BEL4_ACIG2|nr:MAG: aminotransferase class I/II-fold pyridoxal phosphate-dependent enzyme [Candidatus Acididesulfobacter guangdongensis]